MPTYYHRFPEKQNERKKLWTPIGMRFFNGHVEYNHYLSEMEICDKNLWPTDFGEWINYHEWLVYKYASFLFQERRNSEMKQVLNRFSSYFAILKKEGSLVLDFTKIDQSRKAEFDLLKPNLCWSILRGLDLTGLNLYKADLRWADLSGANLACVRGEKSCFQGTYLVNSNLTKGWFPQSDFSKTDFSGADLTDAYLYNCDLSGSNLAGANLTNATIARSNLRDACFRGACMVGSGVWGSIMDGVDLTDADLTDADFSHTIHRE